MESPDSILKFWLDEVGPSGWYDPGPTLDEEIRTRFRTTWEAAREGRFGMWLTHASGALAYIILTDQFPRNMFRGEGTAFATDRAALAAAKQAITRGWDMRIDEPARQFFYMPLMHSENLCDQDRCVRLMKERMPQGRKNNLIHARAHRDVIRRFGRFPYRNDALGRTDTAPEKEFLADGGYGSALEALKQAA